MENRKNKKGLVLLFMGIALLLVAGGWYIANIAEDRNAGKMASELLVKVEEQTGNDSPVITVEGEAFCGKIIIEKLGIELPVFQDWDSGKLKEAPCRYTGSVQTDDMIIAAHNYESHFGNIHLLQLNDEIVFIDGTGSEYRYSVRHITTLDGTAVSDMQSGEWDFTIFTCTKGGKQRVTVRCDRIDLSLGL